eukprot:scaffold18285_cov190-Skeletonema_marinoi.AAC.1
MTIGQQKNTTDGTPRGIFGRGLKGNKWDLLAQLAKTNSANRMSREEMGKNFLAGLKEVLGPSGEGSGST